MLEQKLDQQQQQLKNFGRRSRKDQQGRDYVCGCGKSYLSYPALYTHIKTKHDGQRPQGTCKVGIVVNTKKNTSVLANNNNTTNTNLNNNNNYPNSLQQNPSNHSLNSNHNINSNNNIKYIQITSQLNSQILKAIQQLIKIQDIRILKQMNQEANGFTLPDNRIKKIQVGQILYQSYMNLVRQAQNDIGNQDIINSFINLTNKSSLINVLISYLLGVGKYVSQNMMEYYKRFAKLFYQCYYNHIQQIYQVCYKNNQYYIQTQQLLSKQREKQKQKQKDNTLQKCYQYSYAPSSSKSRSYNNLINKQYINSYTNITNNYNFVNNLNINNKQCKYCPIICQFFIRCYINVENQLEYFKNIMELICNDFCNWMFKKKLTVVEIGLTKKYQVYRKDMINIRDKIVMTNIDYPKTMPLNVQVQQQVSTKVINMSENKQKSKRKQRQKIARIPNINAISNTNNNNSGSKTKIRNQNTKSGPKNTQFSQNEQNQYNCDIQCENNEINDQQSYKIGHQIVAQSVGRDRSGSINQFINGHNFGEIEHQNLHLHENQQLQMQLHGSSNIGENNNNINIGIRNTQNHVNQEEIQQYFSVHKI